MLILKLYSILSHKIALLNTALRIDLNLHQTTDRFKNIIIQEMVTSICFSEKLNHWFLRSQKAAEDCRSGVLI